MKEKWIVLILVLALLYIISPVDVVPDPIPVVGWVDDVAGREKKSFTRSPHKKIPQFRGEDDWERTWI